MANETSPTSPPPEYFFKLMSDGSFVWNPALVKSLVDAVLAELISRLTGK